MYEIGDAISQNMTKAVHHYINAADSMCRNAQWKVANFYESGMQADKHFHHAFYYFDRSARNGHELAMLEAGELYMKGEGIQRDRSWKKQWNEATKELRRY